MRFSANIISEYFLMSIPRQVITTRQAKHQVNILGFPLILYILLNLLLWHGTGIVSRFYDVASLGIDPEIISMATGIVLTLLIAFGAFSISAARLHLPIRDYLQSTGMDLMHKIALVCIGIAVMVLTTYTGTFLKFLMHPASSAYAFVGHFTTNANILKNILYFVLFVLVKPVCDEYIFRGIIQRQLGHYSRFFGVLASSILYAIAQPSLSDAIPSFFLGWYLALLTLRYHSIKPTYKIHLVISLFFWVLAIIPQEYVLIPIIVITLDYIVTLLFLIGNTVNYRIAFMRFPEKKLWKIVFTSSTVIICILLFIAENVLSFL